MKSISLSKHISCPTCSVRITDAVRTCAHACPVGDAGFLQFPTCADTLEFLKVSEDTITRFSNYQPVLFHFPDINWNDHFSDIVGLLKFRQTG